MNMKTSSNKEMPAPTAETIRRILQTLPTSSPMATNDQAKVSANRKNRITHGHRR
jgi:hypothetical protein